MLHVTRLSRFNSPVTWCASTSVRSCSKVSKLVLVSSPAGKAVTATANSKSQKNKSECLHLHTSTLGFDHFFCSKYVEKIQMKSQEAKTVKSVVSWKHHLLFGFILNEKTKLLTVVRYGLQRRQS
ncbi:hypothetical protein GQX74_008982 [Glossina fuscipes]|nr:hypothetical protein GQX74_008982 [Glossina fuscipes]